MTLADLTDAMIFAARDCGAISPSLASAATRTWSTGNGKTQVIARAECLDAILREDNEIRYFRAALSREPEQWNNSDHKWFVIDCCNRAVGDLIDVDQGILRPLRNDSYKRCLASRKYVLSLITKETA